MSVLVDKKVTKEPAVELTNPLSVDPEHLPSVKLRRNATYFAVMVIGYTLVCGNML